MNESGGGRWECRCQRSDTAVCAQMRLKDSPIYLARRGVDFLDGIKCGIQQDS